jgi:cell division protein FtsB
VQNIANIIRELALLISALTAGLTAWNALKKLKHDNTKDDMAELRSDRDLYRQRWLESEKEYDDLNAENEELRKEIRKLKEKQNEK